MTVCLQAKLSVFAVVVTAYAETQVACGLLQVGEYQGAYKVKLVFCAKLLLAMTLLS